jgi:hypothetical protein
MKIVSKSQTKLIKKVLCFAPLCFELILWIGWLWWLIEIEFLFASDLGKRLVKGPNEENSNPHIDCNDSTWKLIE